MSSSNQIAFIDESGAHGFDFGQSVSTHFVVAVILTNNEDIKKLENDFIAIKNKYFPESELKSSKIGNNENRREKILNDIKSLKFTFYALVVDKREIKLTSGLNWKPSFYKFLYGLVYNDLYRTFDTLTIFADEMGSSEFMDGFRKYINSNYQFDLFHKQKFEFSNSNSTILLQLSDVIGGTINRFYWKKSTINLFEKLSDKVAGKVFWPETYSPYTYDEVEIDDKYSEQIISMALQGINHYLEKHKYDKDSIISDRICFLEYLLSIFQYGNKRRYVSTHEILEHLIAYKQEPISQQYLRSQVVAPLRDEGILIASSSPTSSKGGYKIPCSTQDIYEFINRSNTIIQPMLYRLKKFRETVLLGTQGELDILEKLEYESLKRFLDNK